MCQDGRPAVGTTIIPSRMEHLVRARGALAARGRVLDIVIERLVGFEPATDRPPNFSNGPSPPPPTWPTSWTDSTTTAAATWLPSLGPGRTSSRPVGSRDLLGLTGVDDPHGHAQFVADDADRLDQIGIVADHDVATLRVRRNSDSGIRGHCGRWQVDNCPISVEDPSTTDVSGPKSDLLPSSYPSPTDDLCM